MDNRVYKIATATGEITGHLVTGVYPHDNKVSQDGRRLYNTQHRPARRRCRVRPARRRSPRRRAIPFQLTIADVDTLAIRDRIRLDNAIPPWQFTPDEKGTLRAAVE